MAHKTCACADCRELGRRLRKAVNNILQVVKEKPGLSLFYFFISQKIHEKKILFLFIYSKFYCFLCAMKLETQKVGYFETCIFHCILAQEKFYRLCRLLYKRKRNRSNTHPCGTLMTQTVLFKLDVCFLDFLFWILIEINKIIEKK